MATQTTTDLIKYYTALLIMQYSNREKAQGTIAALTALVVMPQKSVQQIIFPSAPTSGTFTLAYGIYITSALNWNASAATVQAALRALPGLGSVVVTGSIAALALSVTFTGVTPSPATILTVASSLTNGGGAVVPTVTDTDLILPLAAQDAFNIYGANIAYGKQLDVIGKYAGVQRTGFGLESNIVLNDADFLTLIRFAVVANSAQSDLYSIQMLLKTFFPDQVFVYDYTTMRMTYLISGSVVSLDLLRVLISQNLLLRPMAVQLSILYAPLITSFFSFRTYDAPAPPNTSPFNTYAAYHQDWPWVSYTYAIL